MDSPNSGLNYMLVRYISEHLIGFPKSTTFDHLNTIELFLEWCCNILQHSFKISQPSSLPEIGLHSGALN